MSTQPNTLPPVLDADLRAWANQLINEIGCKFNCHQLGTVQSFDDTKDTVTVSLNFLRVVPNQLPSGGDPTEPVVPTQKLVPYPLLVDVPVFILSGGGATITMPIAAGDTCLVLFNDRDIDGWYATGQTGAPNSPRIHDLADGLALIGFRSLANPVPAYPADNIALTYAGGQLLVAAKISIANATGSLVTVLSDLITALKDAETTGSQTFNSATISALNNVQTEITNLLK